MGISLITGTLCFFFGRCLFPNKDGSSSDCKPTGDGHAPDMNKWYVSPEVAPHIDKDPEELPANLMESPGEQPELRGHRIGVK